MTLPVRERGRHRGAAARRRRPAPPRAAAAQPDPGCASALLRTTLVPSLLRLVRQNLSRQVAAVRRSSRWRACSARSRAGRRAGRGGAAARAALGVRRGRGGGASRSSGPGATGPRRSSGPRASRKRLCPGWVMWHRCDAVRARPTCIPGASLELWVGEQGVGSVGRAPSESGRGIRDRAAMRAVRAESQRATCRKEKRIPVPGGIQGAFGTPRSGRARRSDAAGGSAGRRRSGRSGDRISSPSRSSIATRGAGVPEGRVSLAFRMVFQRADRTLTDAEVNGVTDRMRRRAR